MTTSENNAKSIFLQALELNSPADRQAYVDTLCNGDLELRREVDELLSHHHGAAESFLDSPPTVVGQSAEQLQTLAPPPSLTFLEPTSRADSLGRLAHYEILEVVGSGGMGVVLKAFDERLQRIVAIKALAASLAASAVGRQRFVREAQAAAAVNHDNVVDIYAVEETGPAPYLVMEYIAGISLDEKLRQQGPLALKEVLRIGLQIADGLAAAHRQGLVHRDVKPANILLENGVERVKITDFGLARAADDASNTQTGVIAGTPAYMSPEQARGDAVDYRSDLFSLGSVLYALCTGQSPFRSSTSLGMLKRVNEETPRPIRELNPGIPDWLCAIVERLHAKAPDERYQSAMELADDLGRCLARLQSPLSTLPKPAMQGSALQPGRANCARSAGRRRLIVVTAISLLVCLATGVGIGEATGTTQFASTIIHIFTPDGTLIVEVDDPGVKVTIEGDGGLVITGAGPQEVRLRPGSYRLKADKDGKRIPLERELVSIAVGGREVVKVKLQPPTTSAETAEPKPFFVFGANGFQRTFDSLADAVQHSADGDTIEIRGNGPFVCDGVTIGHSLVIRAGDGYTPSITLSQASAEKNTPLLTTSASLVLEGLDLRRIDGVSGYPDLLRAWGDGKALEIVNCRFVQGSYAGGSGCLILSKFPICTLRNCQFSTGPSSAKGWCSTIDWYCPAGGRGTIENCVTAAGGLMNLNSSSVVLTIRNNTAVGRCLGLGLKGDEPAADQPLSLDFSENVISCSPTFGSGSILRVDRAGRDQFLPTSGAEDLLLRAVALHEQKNVYASGTQMLYLAVDNGNGENTHESTPGKDLADWNRLWRLTDTGSLEGDVRFQGGDILQRALTAPEQLVPDDFRLSEDSAGYRVGPDGKDLGADVDLVGPGAAYERWKKTPEYQAWLKETGQAAQSESANGMSTDPFSSDEWVWTAPENLGAPVNTEHGEFHPFLAADGLTLVFTSNRPGGQGKQDLWLSVRSSIDDPWQTPVNLGKKVNTPHMEGGACLSGDGLTLLVESDRPGGKGHWDIWKFRRQSREAEWSDAINLGPPINGPWGEGAPCLTPDGLVLLFQTDRPGGEGGDDLWMSHRTSLTSKWLEPVPLGSSVNTQHAETGPNLSSDGRTLFFCSNRTGANAHDDLWMSRRASAFGPWSRPINLGAPYNGGGHDKNPSLSSDARTLVFESGRTGNLGAHDLWMATRIPKIDYIQQAKEHLARGDLNQAAQEFNRALSLVSDLNPYATERLRIVDQFVSSDELFQLVLKLRPDDINLWSHRAHHLAGMGRWDESIACFQKRLELGPDGAGLWKIYSLALLARNDEDGYRSLCEKILANFGDCSDPGEAYHAALAMIVVPDAVADKQQAFRLAERAANGSPNEVWSISVTYAAWLYRLDRLEEAIVWLDKVKEQDNQGISLCFLAMAHHRLGHAEEAWQHADAVRQKKSAWNEEMTWWMRVRVDRLIVEMDSVLAAEPDSAKAPKAEGGQAPTTRDEATDSQSSADGPTASSN